METPFFVEIEKSLDWESGYLNYDNKVVADIREAQVYDSKEDAQQDADLFNATYGRTGQILARVR